MARVPHVCCWKAKTLGSNVWFDLIKHLQENMGGEKSKVGLVAAFRAHQNKIWLWQVQAGLACASEALPNQGSTPECMTHAIV
jgi:hypothetical protein